MRQVLIAALVFAAVESGGAIKLTLTFEDIEQALAIARSREAERAQFHAPYIKEVGTPFVERAEIVSPYRRVVLAAEERQRQGDRLFAYSASRAMSAVEVWQKRVALVARLRFHPQNAYVNVPDVTVSVPGHDAALIGVLKEPVLALPPGRSGEFIPILGAVIEGVFNAEALGQAEREFVIAVDGQEVGRVRFDLARLD